MRVKKKVTVTKEVLIEYDENLFYPEYISAFKSVFYDLDSPEEFAKDIAKLYAEGNLDACECYDVKKMGIKLSNNFCDVDIDDVE